MKRDIKTNEINGIKVSRDIKGVMIVHSKVIKDSRGFFYRAFCEADHASILLNRSIKQINLSSTESVGAIRGIHFQFPPKSEMKLVRCIQGKVWDVVVDLRRDSETFLKWSSFILDGQEGSMLVVPEGCAHGFQALEKNSMLLYLHTDSYSPQYEGGIRYNEPRLSIEWPLPVTDISERDLTHPFLDHHFDGI
jgi:dTDP-4-dehydrorhamnose 3,5-epimerase